MTIDKLRAAVGWTYREREDVVERRHLRAFRHAIGEDPDDETVPPTFTACFLDEPPPMPEAEAYGLGWLNGGDRFEYHAPLRLGDVIRSRLRFQDVIEKDGKSGKMAILTFVTEFRRPDGELVVRHVGTRIRR
ncbi:FAS1-like dehydratase domain-containing protein [Streptosporangium soli]|nr:MaoC family dehydratase N-terminal domain-containing protein [Streptosporangium sp. KLBMP 9127]